MRISLPLLITLALVPVCIGTSIFLAWYATRWDILVLAGGYSLLGGGIVVVLTLVLLSCFVTAHLREGSFTQERKQQATLVAGLSVLSISAGLAFSYLVALIGTQIHVEVVNESDVVIEKATLVGPAQELELAPINPGQATGAKFNPKGEGRLVLTIRALGRDASTIVVGYVPDPNGANVRVTVNKKLKMLVSQLN